MKPEFYLKKNIHYYNEWREDIFNILKYKVPFNRSLEIGCGSGILSRELKKHKISFYTAGVEPFANLSEDSNFDLFYIKTIEDSLEELKKQEKFDLIILADVLEHTLDPWIILRTLSSVCLADNGLVIISLPNFRNLMTLHRIIFKNSFKYENEGVFDITHLRFFCIPDIKELIISSELQIEYITPSFLHKAYKLFSVNRLRIISALTFGLFKFLLADQVVTVCRKNTNNEKSNSGLN